MAYLAKPVILSQLLDEAPDAHVEDPGHQLRCIQCSLTWQQVALDLGPVRVARHGYEHRRAPKATHQGHGVLQAATQQNGR